MNSMMNSNRDVSRSGRFPPLAGRMVSPVPDGARTNGARARTFVKMRPMPLARSSRRPLAPIGPPSASSGRQRRRDSRMPIRNLATRSRFNACHVDRGVSLGGQLSRCGPRRRGRRPARSPTPSVARTRHPTVAMTIAIAASARATPALPVHTRVALVASRGCGTSTSVPAGVPTASRFGAAPSPRRCAFAPSRGSAPPSAARVPTPPRSRYPPRRIPTT